MNVAELIAELQKQPQDMLVVVRGYEEGYNTVTGLGRSEVLLDVNPEDYYGDHEEATECARTKYPNATAASAVVVLPSWDMDEVD